MPLSRYPASSLTSDLQEDDPDCGREGGHLAYVRPCVAGLQPSDGQAPVGGVREAGTYPGLASVRGVADGEQIEGAAAV